MVTNTVEKLMKEMKHGMVRYRFMSEMRYVCGRLCPPANVDLYLVQTVIIMCG